MNQFDCFLMFSHRVSVEDGLVMSNPVSPAPDAFNAVVQGLAASGKMRSGEIMGNPTAPDKALESLRCQMFPEAKCQSRRNVVLRHADAMRSLFIRDRDRQLGPKPSIQQIYKCRVSKPFFTDLEGERLLNSVPT